jgi:hypothetical protein
MFSSPQNLSLKYEARAQPKADKIEPDLPLGFSKKKKNSIKNVNHPLPEWT